MYRFVTDELPKHRMEPAVLAKNHESAEGPMYVLLSTLLQLRPMDQGSENVKSMEIFDIRAFAKLSRGRFVVVVKLW